MRSMVVSRLQWGDGEMGSYSKDTLSVWDDVRITEILRSLLELECSLAVRTYLVNSRNNHDWQCLFPSIADSLQPLHVFS